MVVKGGSKETIWERNTIIQVRGDEIKGNFHYMLPSKLRALDLLFQIFKDLFNSNRLVVLFRVRSSIPPIVLLPQSIQLL